MTPPKFAAADVSSLPIFLLDPQGVEPFLEAQPKAWQVWLQTTGFAAGFGETQLIPGEAGEPAAAVIGLGAPELQARGRFAAAKAVSALPTGSIWHLAGSPSPEQAAEAALAWLLASYHFSLASKATQKDWPKLKAPEGIDAPRLEAIAAGEFLTRDLINTPSNLMGPAELSQAAQDLADSFGASCEITEGDALLSENFPLIHTVGRASSRAPRLIDMRWGQSGPKLTLVGKGVCFDTGGLNLKPGASMGLMKKDMGGSATVLGLARMIMAMELPLQLRVLIPAVENAVGGSAFRPQDVLTARNGLTVEINNTDAEGRLVLADALAYGDEESPDLLISMATLTGAARVAVGADLAPYFTDQEPLSAALAQAAVKVQDPVWRLPFHRPYESQIEPGIADVDNAPAGGQAGSITAALFLDRFVANTRNYMHFDIYGWQPAAAPGRPKGGVGQGARALFEALPQMLDLA
ncbi:MAG: leucyl aminopeptidase family protein [Mangrovicoccus sp.]